jgi:hypothetical protein
MGTFADRRLTSLTLFTIAATITLLNGFLLYQTLLR